MGSCHPQQHFPKIQVARAAMGEVPDAAAFAGESVCVVGAASVLPRKPLPESRVLERGMFVATIRQLKDEHSRKVRSLLGSIDALEKQLAASKAMRSDTRCCIRAVVGQACCAAWGLRRSSPLALLN